MRVIVPYKDVDGRPYSSIIISGGIERFIKTMAENIPEVEIFEIKNNDYEQAMLVDFVKEARDCDLAICNYPNRHFNSLLSVRLDIPIAWICHHSAGVAKNWRETVNEMKRFVARPGNSLWMVSRWQHKRWMECSGPGFPLISGIVAPSFAEVNHWQPRARVYDAITVSRCDEIKDPFLLHRICCNHFSSCVATNSIDTPYFKSNQAWRKPQTTNWNLHHSLVLEAISKSSVYVATWPDETYGIAVLEALSLGVPVILLTSGRGHASAEFLRDGNSVTVDVKDHEGVRKAIRELGKYDDKKREKILRDTWKNHGRDAWKNQMYNALKRMTRIENEKSKVSG